MDFTATPASTDVPPMTGPRPGGLSLLAPAERGLCLAIMQADRCGRGGEDLEVLGGTKYSTDRDQAAQLKNRLSMLTRWNERGTQKQR